MRRNIRRTMCGFGQVLLLLTTVMVCVPLSAGAAGLRFYGDLLLSRGIDRYVRDRGAEPVRRALAPFLARDAFHVVNLEGAVGNVCNAGKNPCFPIRPPMLVLLNGFDLVSLENNHALDTGNGGAAWTAESLRRHGIAVLAEKKPYASVETGAGTIAVIAATDVVNAAGDRKHLLAADAPELLAEIRRLKRTAGVVAVYVHWGRELIAAPTERMKELARRYTAVGADVVVGTHPHVPGGVSCIEGRPVVWSLGNFLFDQKYDATKKGAVLDCDINGGRLACRLSGHETGRGSYLPVSAAGDPYRYENAVLAACTPAARAVWTGKFNGSSREKRLELAPDGKRSSLSRLELYDLGSGRLEARSPAMPIRKVQPVDLNGDGIKEVMLLQDIYSSLDREVAKRLYLYSFDGGFHALWRGSALSRPLLDAAFTTGRKKPLLVALHSDETFLKRKPGTARRTLMRYQWNGFGFSGMGEREAPEGARGLRLAGDRVKFFR